MAEISVIMATWNRSSIIGYSIESVLHQTYQDWELIVVGDHCTDDTEAVVASFNDPRIRFINLESNFGEQSRPNNVGIAEAIGEYCAFLNHDDLWFPDHLESSLSCLTRNQADLVFSGSIAPFPDGTLILKSVIRGQTYDPLIDCPASSWLFKRTIYNELGGMKPAVKLYSYPSNEFLFRANKAGYHLIGNKHVTLVAIHSGYRKNSYLNSGSSENQQVLQQIKTNSAYREELLERYSIQMTEELNSVKGAWFTGLKKIIRNTSYRLVSWMGVPPLTVKNFFRYGKRGGFLNHLRKTRGLKALIKKGERNNE